MLMNMKKPTLVGIFIFISRENFMLSSAEHEKVYILGTWSSIASQVIIFVSPTTGRSQTYTLFFFNFSTTVLQIRRGKTDNLEKISHAYPLKHIL